MVNVTHFKACPVTGQTAGTQGTQTALMGQFSQRIGLIHELGQLAGPKEFLYCCCNRTNIYKSLGRRRINILDGHPLTNHPFHTGKTYTELVLEEFSHRAETSVPQVIDIINTPYTMIQVENVADGGNDVFLGYMPGHQVILIFPEQGYQLFLFCLLILFENFHEDIIPHLFGDARSGRIEINITCDINGEVSDNLYRLAINLHMNHIGS